jgi:hypothetical protein
MRGSGMLSRMRASWITLIRRWLSPRGIGVFPSALIRIFVYDSISRLDDFAREYRGYVGKVMDYVWMYGYLLKRISEVAEEYG